MLGCTHVFFEDAPLRHRRAAAGAHAFPTYAWPGPPAASVIHRPPETPPGAPRHPHEHHPPRDSRRRPRPARFLSQTPVPTRSTDDETIVVAHAGVRPVAVGPAGRRTAAA